MTTDASLFLTTTITANSSFPLMDSVLLRLLSDPTFASHVASCIEKDKVDQANKQEEDAQLREEEDAEIVKHKKAVASKAKRDAISKKEPAAKKGMSLRRSLKSISEYLC